MRRTTRNNIMLAKNRGTKVREGKREDLPIFYRILKETSQRRRFGVESEEFYMDLWRFLEPKGHIKLFVAENEGEPVSSLLVIPFGDTVVAKKHAWIGCKSWLRPNELLFWKAIEWSMDNGFLHFDMDGINYLNALALLEGKHLPKAILCSGTRFKLGFGGSIVLLQPAYECVSGGFLRLILRTSSSLVGLHNAAGMFDRVLFRD
jgi:hypothetical protein